MPRAGDSRRGFTLVEVLIVVVVIAILAVIVIPRLLPSVREAREAELRAQLHALRNAIVLFRAHCGDWPGRLSDVVAADGTGLVGGSGLAIPPSSYLGPYFTSSPDGQLPIDPFTGASDWSYDPITGAVHSRATGPALDGTAYSSW
jgi:general secretion pathway protein G